MTALICVGMIAGAYGVRGEVRVKSYCANPSDIEHYAPLLDETGAQSFELSLIGSNQEWFFGPHHRGGDQRASRFAAQHAPICPARRSASLAR